MNCLEARREILAHPDALGSDARSHVSECEACRALHVQTSILDRDIAEALAVPVPSGLVERVLARQRPRPAGMHQRVLALAAGLLLAVALVLTAWLGRDDPLARAGIDFVVDREASAILTAKPADPNALARVTQALRVELPQREGEVRYIGICPFEGTIAHHVVVMTPDGKATLLLIPERTLAAKGDASARGLRSVARPSGVGSVVIVGSAHAVRHLDRIMTRS